MAKLKMFLLCEYGCGWITCIAVTSLYECLVGKEYVMANWTPSIVAVPVSLMLIAYVLVSGALREDLNDVERSA